METAHKIIEFGLGLGWVILFVLLIFTVLNLVNRINVLVEMLEKEKHDHSERDHSKREPPKYRGEPLFSANLTWAVVAIGLLVSAIIAIAVLTSL